jgi:hypothetical protein
VDFRDICFQSVETWEPFLIGLFGTHVRDGNRNLTVSIDSFGRELFPEADCGHAIDRAAAVFPWQNGM